MVHGLQGAKLTSPIFSKAVSILRKSDWTRLTGFAVTPESAWHLPWPGSSAHQATKTPWHNRGMPRGRASPSITHHPSLPLMWNTPEAVWGMGFQELSWPNAAMVGEPTEERKKKSQHQTTTKSVGWISQQEKERMHGEAGRADKHQNHGKVRLHCQKQQKKQAAQSVSSAPRRRGVSPQVE